jgi:cytochrome c oxidase subunit 1
MMGLNGIFAIMAAIGGLMFVVIVVRSVFFGRKLAEDEKPDYPEVPPQGEVVSHYGSAEKLHIPGTVFLVGIFFVAFVLYYFVNWKYLSEVWPLS